MRFATEIPAFCPTYATAACPNILTNSTIAAARSQKTMDELYDAYEELLERKRQDERRYRYEDAEIIPQLHSECFNSEIQKG